MFLSFSFFVFFSHSTEIHECAGYGEGVDITQLKISPESTYFFFNFLNLFFFLTNSFSFNKHFNKLTLKQKLSKVIGMILN